MCHLTELSVCWSDVWLNQKCLMTRCFTYLVHALFLSVSAVLLVTCRVHAMILINCYVSLSYHLWFCVYLHSIHEWTFHHTRTGSDTLTFVAIPLFIPTFWGRMTVLVSDRKRREHRRRSCKQVSAERDSACELRAVPETSLLWRRQLQYDALF